MRVRYVERLPAPTAFRVFGVVALVFAIGAAAHLVAQLRADAAPAGAFIALGSLTLVLVAVALLMLCLHIRLVVDGAAVRLALWPVWKVDLDAADLAVRITTASPAGWRGVGLRRGHGPDGEVFRALLLTAGPAVMLLDGRSGVRYVLRSDQPGAFVNAVRAAERPRPSSPRREQHRADAVDVRIMHPEVHARIWRDVPAVGPAPTVQGELLRAVENLWDEAQRNGNQNWDADHQRLVDHLRRHLLDGTLPAHEAQVQRDLHAVQQDATPVTDAELWVRLVDAVCDWCIAHPTPIPRRLDPLGAPAVASAESVPTAPRRREADLVLPARSTAPLREVAAAWLLDLASASRVVAEATDLLVQTDDVDTFLQLAILPVAPATDEVTAALQETFERADDSTALTGETRQLLALRWACHEALEGRLPAQDLCTWAGRLSQRHGVEALADFDALGDVYDRDRDDDRLSSSEELDAQVLTAAASYLARSMGLVRD